MAMPYALAPLPVHPGPDCVELYRAEALALPAERVRSAFEPPIRVIVDEGHDLGELAHKFWRPSDPAVPGLEVVAFRVPATTPARLVTLSTGVREMSLVVALGRGNAALRATFEEGEDALRTLRRHIGFFLDDGVETAEDLHFARLGDDHSDTGSVDRLSGALYDFARLGEELGPAMVSAGMTTWDPALVDHAFALHRSLQSAKPIAERADVDLRNRLLTLLQEEMARVRRAAEYLWSRSHPSVYRLFLSPWSRNRRLAARRRQLRETAEAETAGKATAAADLSPAPVLADD